jgi:hypothetical protein
LTLDKEVGLARKEIVTDGYDMSVGELANLYTDNELIINPEFQRLFRWDETRKTRFIESLLLGIPIPPIFVFQNDDGVWELVDGLQRISTLLQFMNILKGEIGEKLGPLVLNGTKLLPTLEGKRWKESSARSKDGIGKILQLEIKRARFRVEILKKESDVQAKFELFQRLNTGGASLTEQEVRNSIAVMLNKPFHDWLIECSKFEPFRNTTAQTLDAVQAQAPVELVLRLIAFRHVLDVHEYLDHALYEIASGNSFDMNKETKVFESTFTFLDEALGDGAFKRWDGTSFKGKFLMSVFEVIATGVSKNLKSISNMKPKERSTFLQTRAKSLWSNTEFTKNSGAGVRGTTRLSNLLPMADKYMKL